MKKWKTNSWRNYPVKHIPEYEDKKELDMVLGKLKNFPPLVFAGETRTLKKQFQTCKRLLLEGEKCSCLLMMIVKLLAKILDINLIFRTVMTI